MTKSGFIFDIKKFAIHDGPGIRTTVFFKGCSMNCWWCHNPESQNTEPELIQKKGNKKDIHSSESQEIIGREITTDEVMEEIEKDMIFYKESNGGVTFSGGEALHQPEFLISILKRCKEKNIHTALDTSGYAEREILEGVMGLVDLFLYDLKLIDEDKHTHYTSVSNKVILDNLRLLIDNRKKVIIRIPIIPGITDTEDNLSKLVEFIKSLKNISEVNLLPYNKMGEEKYRRLRRVYKTEEIKPPSEEEILDIKSYFENFGFNVEIGG